MKNFLSIFLIILAFEPSVLAQVCADQGTSTNPDSPSSPTAPTTNSEHWLNTFNWYEDDGSSLLNFFMYDMFAYSANQTSMSNPYSDVNALYPHISNVPIDMKDFRPENGWELISVNLGAFPNGELLTDHPPLQSNFSQIPYLILYNKNRGILRLFANSLTGLDNGFDHVVVTLRFVDPIAEASGLLRHYSGFDQALDRNTTATLVSTVVNHPNNSQHWFQADFQVGYDPCTCLFRSNLSFEFQFVDLLEINMVSNSISTEIATVNSDGTTNIPNDFLSGVKYNDDFEGAGMLIYSTQEKLIDDYLERLEYVEAYNAGVGADIRKIKRKQTIMSVLKWAVQTGGAAAIPNSLAQNLTLYATDLLEEYNLLGEDTVKIKQEDLEKEAKKLLGKGMDWLSNEWIGEAPTKLSASPPTAVISTTTFNGTIVNNTLVSGPTLLNPGTYPIGAAGNEINPHNFPVYNEILGLFALLESPKIKMAHSIESEVLTETTEWGSDPLAKYRTYDIHNNFKLTLDKPLKYTFNPAAGIDMANVQIEAMVEAKFKVVGHPYTTWDNLQVHIDPFQYCWQKKRFPNESSHIVELDNLDLDFISENPTSIPITEDFDVEASSRFIPLTNFNTLVGEISVANTEKWGLRRCSTPNASTWDQAWNQLVEDAKIELNEVEFYLKLMVIMPFTQLGYNGENLQTVQYFTYLLNSENDIVLVDASAPQLITPWSFNQNPNNGTMPVQEILTLEEKIWTLDDYSAWGGTSPENLQVYASDRIIINGNQIMGPGVASVEFIAPNEIVVHDEAQLFGNLTLRLENFVELTSTPTSPVNSTYLSSYCAGQIPNSYQANIGSRSEEVRPPQPIETPEALSFQAALLVYPNLVTTQNDIKLETNSSFAAIRIYSLVGALVYAVEFDKKSNTEEFKIDCSKFANGIYTVTTTHINGDVNNKKLIIRR